MIRRVLQWLGIIRAFEPNEVEQAEADNALRDLDATMFNYTQRSEGLSLARTKLLSSIREVKSEAQRAQRTGQDAMAQLVHDMRSSGHHHQRN